MKHKEAREQIGLSVRRFSEEAGISTRTTQDIESGKRDMRKATGVKVGPVFARHGINPTDVEEVSEALGVPPRHRPADADQSDIYEDAELRKRIAQVVDRHMQQLRVELEAEVRRLIEGEVERRVSEEAAQTTLRRE